MEEHIILHAIYRMNDHDSPMVAVETQFVPLKRILHLNLVKSPLFITYEDFATRIYDGPGGPFIWST